MTVGKAAAEAWPAAAQVLNPMGASDIVLICEHASNYIPPDYEGLGLLPSDLTRHIAWDIGAGAVTRMLSEKLDAVALLGQYSRLLVDLNRPLESPTCIPIRSESTDIPGNINITKEDRDARISRIFRPFQDTVAAHLDERAAGGRSTTIVAIHSFTPVFLGQSRPWHAGILFDKSRTYGERVIRALRRHTGLTVEANIPYVIDRMEDYAIPVHGEDRGHDAILVEIRQDLISTATGQAEWASRLGDALLAST